MAAFRHAIVTLILFGATPALALSSDGSPPPGLGEPTEGSDSLLPAPGLGFGAGAPAMAMPQPAMRKGEEPSKGEALKPVPSVAERRKLRLDDLFSRLAAAKDQPEAHAIGILIKTELLRSGSDTADLLMQRAMTAAAAKNNDLAQQLLDKIVVLRPEWAEAWNERATLRYMGDDDVGAMEDIGHVLALEPRHFGALSGMGMILHRNGDDKDALLVLRRAAVINPQDTDVKSLIDKLTPAVEGHEL